MLGDVKMIGVSQAFRADLITTTFSFYCVGERKWILLVESLGLSVLAMLSKEQGITALSLCLVYDFFNFNQVTS